MSDTRTPGYCSGSTALPSREVQILSARLAELVAAAEAMTANIDRWLETDVPATPEESKVLYENLTAAIAAAKELLP